MADGTLPVTKVCTKCGHEKPLAEFHSKRGAKGGRNPSCKPCYNAVRRAGLDPVRNRVMCKAWRDANIDLARSNDRSRYAGERREKRLARARDDWAKLTLEEKAAKRAAIQEWKDANPDLVRAMWDRTYAKHKAKHFEKTARWRRENPEAYSAIRDRRRAAEAGAAGSYTAEDVRHLLQTQGRVCRYCDCLLTKFHVDHFVPLARGGSNGPENLVLSCPTCNFRKGAKMPWDWMPARFKKPPG